MRDVEGWQPPVNRRVTRGLLAWLLRATFGFGGTPSPVLLRLLGSSSSPSSSRPRSLPPDPPTLSPLVLGLSPLPVPPAAPLRPPAAGFLRACPRRSLLHHLRSSWLLWPRLPAQYHRCPRYLRPCRFWAWGLSVHASSGSC